MANFAAPALANFAALVAANFTLVASSPAAAGLAAIAGMLGWLVLLSARQAVANTTLASAWWWSLAALAAWSGLENAAGLRLVTDAGWLAPLRLAAIGLSFCPVISLIGAKRPQHAAWNFIVLSLWGIVMLPAAETFFLQRGQTLEMGDARGWFLWILIALAPINYVPTRFWLAALLVAAGQIVALGFYLPLVRRELFSHASAAGVALAGAALVAAWLAARRQRKEANPYDRLWLDFRDRFGLLWSLRVQERVNALAQQEGWPLELAWGGFCDPASGAPLAAIDQVIEPTLRVSLTALLRRFVDRDWIAERLLTDIN
jgi:hypothetical protein